MGQTVVWRTEAVKQSRAFSLELGDFIDGISIRLVTLNYGACFVPEVLGMTRRLENSFSDKYRYHPKSYMDLMEQSEKIMLSETYSSKFPAPNPSLQKETVHSRSHQLCRQFQQGQYQNLRLHCEHVL